MRKKNALWMCLVTLLLFNVFGVQVGAPQTVISVDPKSYTAPGIGVTFTINVKIADVTNLFGYDFMLFYDTTVLDGVDVTLPPGHFLTPTDPSKILKPKLEVDDAYNATHGRVWVAVTLISPESPKSGSGTLATITFKATALGKSALQFAAEPPFPYPVKLADNKGDPIPCTAVNGEVTTSAQPAPSEPSASFPLVNVVIVILTAIFFVAALYYLRKRIS